MGMGFATVARDMKRAEKAGAILEGGEKWIAFGRGCANGVAAFLLLIAALVIVFLIGEHLENWRWKREQAQRENK